LAHITPVEMVVYIANYSDVSVNNNCKRHNPQGELLIGQISGNDKITMRNVKTNNNKQIKLL